MRKTNLVLFSAVCLPKILFFQARTELLSETENGSGGEESNEQIHLTSLNKKANEINLEGEPEMREFSGNESGKLSAGLNHSLMPRRVDFMTRTVLDSINECLENTLKSIERGLHRLFPSEEEKNIIAMKKKDMKNLEREKRKLPRNPKRDVGRKEKQGSVSENVEEPDKNEDEVALEKWKNRCYLITRDFFFYGIFVREFVHSNQNVEDIKFMYDWFLKNDEHKVIEHGLNFDKNEVREQLHNNFIRALKMREHTSFNLNAPRRLEVDGQLIKYHDTSLHDMFLKLWELGEDRQHVLFLTLVKQWMMEDKSFNEELDQIAARSLLTLRKCLSQAKKKSLASPIKEIDRLLIGLAPEKEYTKEQLQEESCKFKRNSLLQMSSDRIYFALFWLLLQGPEGTISGKGGEQHCQVHFSNAIRPMNISAQFYLLLRVVGKISVAELGLYGEAFETQGILNKKAILGVEFDPKIERRIYQDIYDRCLVSQHGGNTVSPVDEEAQKYVQAKREELEYHLNRILNFRKRRYQLKDWPETDEASDSFELWMCIQHFKYRSEVTEISLYVGDLTLLDLFRKIESDTS